MDCRSAVLQWRWSVLNPHGIRNRWSSAGRSGHEGTQELQVIRSYSSRRLVSVKVARRLFIYATNVQFRQKAEQVL
jgi:hypothetical protein